MKGCEGVLGWHGVCLIEMQGAALQQPAGAGVGQVVVGSLEVAMGR